MMKKIPPIAPPLNIPNNFKDFFPTIVKPSSLAVSL